MSLHSQDEIALYTSARYLSSVEAMYRIMGYCLNGRFPTVQTLPVHLENEDWVTCDQTDADWRTIVAAKTSPLELYMHRPARWATMRYAEFFEKNHHIGEKRWKPRVIP